uniref:hypothetical protein n=1 Tax=Paracidovorax oryzae TaxID=862720 RepID=UPI0035D0BC79
MHKEEGSWTGLALYHLAEASEENDGERYKEHCWNILFHTQPTTALPLLQFLKLILKGLEWKTLFHLLKHHELGTEERTEKLDIEVPKN